MKTAPKTQRRQLFSKPAAPKRLSGRVAAKGRTGNSHTRSAIAWKRFVGMGVRIARSAPNDAHAHSNSVELRRWTGVDVYDVNARARPSQAPPVATATESAAACNAAGPSAYVAQGNELLNSSSYSMDTLRARSWAIRDEAQIRFVKPISSRCRGAGDDDAGDVGRRGSHRGRIHDHDVMLVALRILPAGRALAGEKRL